MTDSESDTSNVFTFQNANTTVSAKGPNTNVSYLSFRNPTTSTMCMPRNFERQRYAESTYDQRSMYYRRETSPMSIHSACDIRPRNYQQHYPGMSSQQSVFNGRNGSSMSVRSIDSTASYVSAADIAFTINNAKFNKYDLKVIKDAYQKLMKMRVRKRIEKRRNMRMFLKRSRRRSGDDSGEQGSNSSISSDDCRSIKTSYKENMSSSRSARLDLTDFRKTVRDNNMLQDCSDKVRQNTLKNKFSDGSSKVNNNQIFNNTSTSTTSKQINPMFTQKDRFKNGFLLPSQRFNRSVASSVIMENSEKPHKDTGKNVMNNCQSGSEEEIFNEITAVEKSTLNTESQRKRSLDSEDESSLPERKKSRITSPIKTTPKNKRAPSKPKNVNPTNNNIELSNSFEFAKPSLPVRKSKPRVQEKLIAKSSQPLTAFIEPIPNKIQENVQVLQPSYLQEKSSENPSQLDQSETTLNSDVSSRPSFIKRKLFTQTLDVTEKANLSCTNSPQNSISSLQKEKNKARKLVTKQSCLSREVQDDNNLLDLIHKIVPPHQMNLTNQTTINQTQSDVNKKDSEDKWDVTSIITMYNEDDVSDTYTDEEIFEANITKDTKKNKGLDDKAKSKNIGQVENNEVIPIRDCEIILDDILQKQVVNQNFNLTHNNVTKNNIKSNLKTFWDTDFESDTECRTVLPRSHVFDNLKKATATWDITKQNFKNTIGCASSDISKKKQNISELPKPNNTLMNSTVNSMRTFNTSTLSIRSHRISKKKKCCSETSANETQPKLDVKNKILVEKENKHKSNKPAKKKIENINSKANLQSIKSSIIPKSTSQCKKILEETKSNKNKEIVIPDKNIKKLESKSKTQKSSCANKKNTITQKHETQKNGSAVKNKVEKQSESMKGKNNSKSSTSDNHKNKKGLHKSPNNKLKSKTDPQYNSKQSKKNNPVSNPTKLNLNNTVELIQKKSDRPVRSCRTPSQSRSIELSRSAQLDNTCSDTNSSLRSKVNNLSSSNENITSKRSKKNNPVSNPTKSNLNNTVEPILTTTVTSGRPVRSCRTPSQSRSIELSRSVQLENTSADSYRSLRSRVINLSSSIENITINMKPKNKIYKNENIYNRTRKSDVSFSLGSKEQTPTPKKNSSRKRADFFKGKRKS